MPLLRVSLAVTAVHGCCKVCCTVHASGGEEPMSPRQRSLKETMFGGGRPLGNLQRAGDVPPYAERTPRERKLLGAAAKSKSIEESPPSEASTELPSEPGSPSIVSFASTTHAGVLDLFSSGDLCVRTVQTRNLHYEVERNEIRANKCSLAAPWLNPNYYKMDSDEAFPRDFAVLIDAHKLRDNTLVVSEKDLNSSSQVNGKPILEPKAFDRRWAEIRDILRKDQEFQNARGDPDEPIENSEILYDQSRLPRDAIVGLLYKRGDQPFNVNDKRSRKCVPEQVKGSKTSTLVGKRLPVYTYWKETDAQTGAVSHRMQHVYTIDANERGC